jgi:hypothetical protein
MDDRFLTWDDFVKNFGRELRIAAEVHEGMVAGALQDNCLPVWSSPRDHQVYRPKARGSRGER